MKHHRFDTSFEAYDNTQWNEEIKTGHILIIENEKIVGVADTWPFAVTTTHGELHTPNDTITLDGLIESMEGNCSQFKQDVNFKESFKEAVKIANDFNFDVLDLFKEKHNIMKVETRYVITNTQHLINPAGYDSSQPVYEETEVAIFLNEIPEPVTLPQGEKLWIHDIYQLTGKK